MSDRFLVDRPNKAVYSYTDALALAHPTWEEVFADTPQDALTTQASNNGFTNQQLRGVAVPVSIVAGGGGAIGAVTQSGVWSVGRTWTLAPGTDGVTSFQGGAWAVTAAQAGAWAVSFTAPQHIIVDSGSVTLAAGAAVIGHVVVDSGAITANIGTSGALALEAGGNLATIAGKDFATQTTLALVKAKTDNLDVALSTRLKPADTLAGVTTVAAVTAITNALPVGANVIGKTGIDQTTPGTSNKVFIGADGTVTLLAGAAVIGHVLVDSGTVTNLQQMNGQAIAMGTGLRTAGTQRVTIATDDSVPVTNANLDVALSTRASAAAQTDGTQKAITRGGAKGATAAADITSTVEGVDHQAQDVQLYHGGVAKDPTAIRALTGADVVTANAGANLNTSALAVEAGGNLAALVAKDFSTSAKQDTGNTSLASIDSKTGTMEAKPAAYTELDRLYQLGVKLDKLSQGVATEATLLRLAPVKALVKPTATLLHRS